MEETTRKAIGSKVNLDFSRKHCSLKKYCTKREGGNKHIHKNVYGYIFICLLGSLCGFSFNFFTQVVLSVEFLRMYFFLFKTTYMNLNFYTIIFCGKSLQKFHLSSGSVQVCYEIATFLLMYRPSSFPIPPTQYTLLMPSKVTTVTHIIKYYT